VVADGHAERADQVEPGGDADVGPAEAPAPRERDGGEDGEEGEDDEDGDGVVLGA